MLSPVNIDSSTADFPSITRPSLGMRSPGRTRTRSPGSSASTGTGTRSVPSILVASAGLSATSPRTASVRRFFAFASSVLPSRTNVTMAPAASK